MASKKLFKVLWSSAFACALLFGGWGFPHFQTFFDQPARTAFLFLLLARNAGEALSLRTNLLSTRGLGGFQRWIPALSRLTMVFLCWFLPFADAREILTITGVQTPRYIGLLLFSAGGAIQLVAIRTLGTHYSVHVTLQNEHRLVQDGLYRIIRHPIYLGLLLNMLGTPLVFRSWLIIPVLALAVVFVAVRIRQEEALLGEEFGPEFEMYRRRTKLLVPYLC